MESLSAETLTAIASYCNSNARKSLRLVNKQLADASAPELFRDISLTLLPESVAIFERISSKYGKCVRRIILYDDVAPDLDKNHYDFVVDQILKKRSKLRNSSPLEDEMPDRETCWESYQSLVRRQKNLSLCCEGTRFKHAFARCSGLAEVTIIHAGDNRDLAAMLWAKVKRDTLLDPFNWDGLIRNNKDLETPLSTFAAHSLLDAIEYRSRIPRSRYWRPLKLSLNAYWSTFEKKAVLTAFPGTASLRLDSSQLDKAYEALTHLCVTSWDTKNTNRGEHFLPTGLNHVLRAARNLESLEILVNKDDAPMDKYLKVFRSSKVVWPRLKNFKLSASFTSKNLLKVLSNHAPTLRSLELYDMYLDNVPHVLDRIPKILELDHVYIRSLIDTGAAEPSKANEAYLWTLRNGTDAIGAFEREMTEFLLRERAEMPDLERDHRSVSRPHTRRRGEEYEFRTRVFIRMGPSSTPGSTPFDALPSTMKELREYMRSRRNEEY